MRRSTMRGSGTKHGAAAKRRAGAAIAALSCAALLAGCSGGGVPGMNPGSGGDGDGGLVDTEFGQAVINGATTTIVAPPGYTGAGAGDGAGSGSGSEESGDGNDPTTSEESAFEGRGTPVLGSSAGQYSIGYGEVRPDLTSLSSVCANSMSNITWDSWGGPTATGTGVPCSNPSATVRIVAGDLGDCNGTFAYRSIQYDDGEVQNICH